MPWSLQNRNGEWCVVKEGESSPVPGGCHSSRADAIKHQRALYSNEARMASIYADLDERTEEWVEPEPDFNVVPPDSENSFEVFKDSFSRTMRIEIPSDDALTASVMQQMERMSERQARTDEALVAALEAIGAREPIINVHPQAAAVEVNVPPATVEVNVPPAQVEVNVPPAEVNVQAPEVNVTVEAPAPVQKTVTFERDPLTNQVVKAEVVES